MDTHNSFLHCPLFQITSSSGGLSTPQPPVPCLSGFNQNERTIPNFLFVPQLEKPNKLFSFMYQIEQMKHYNHQNNVLPIQFDFLKRSIQ